MIKGVNHQVVEVNDTASEYFERIIFFVKPEYSFLSEGKLRENAGRIANTATLPPPKAKSKRKLGDILKTAFAVLLGAGVTAFIFMTR